MWAKQKNGNIKTYNRLPEYYKNYIGFNLLDVSTHNSEGFYEVIIPEFSGQTQYLGEIYWNETITGFTYTIIDRVFDLEELRQERLEEFSTVIDEFAILIARCQLINGHENEDLNLAIEQTRQMRISTINAINAIDNVNEMLEFKIKPEDINYYKSLYDSFK